MNTISSSGESHPRELQWDRAALAKVFGYLDATTLVNVQLASKSFREIVKNDSVWEYVLFVLYGRVCDSPALLRVLLHVYYYCTAGRHSETISRIMRSA